MTITPTTNTTTTTNRSTIETANDLDGDLVALSVLSGRAQDLVRVCALTPHSRTEHEASLDRSGVRAGDAQ